MNRDDEILRAIRIAFADCCRPEHFTDYTHCRSRCLGCNAVTKCCRTKRFSELLRLSRWLLPASAGAELGVRQPRSRDP